MSKQKEYVERKSVFYDGILLLNEKELKKWDFLNERFKALCAQIENENQSPDWKNDWTNDGLSIPWENTQRQFAYFENSLKPNSRKRAKECDLHYDGSPYILFTRKKKREYFYSEEELESYKRINIPKINEVAMKKSYIEETTAIKVLILCPFCGKKYEQGLWQCPYCGA